MVTFAGQLLLGGRLEEGGWRGYLLPCLYKEYNILFSSVAVSAFWIHPARQLKVEKLQFQVELQELKKGN